MGFVLSFDTDKTIAVVVSKDSAVHCTEEEYEQYQQTLDESLLHLDGEPTRFILKKTLAYKDTQRVINAQMSFDEETKKPKMNAAFFMEEVRCALVGMTGPGSDGFKKDPDGCAASGIVNYLYNAGVLMDLFNARKNVSGDSDAELSKKS